VSVEQLRRSADYAAQLARAVKKARLCRECGAPILRKRELIELLDERSRSAKAAHKLLAFTAAQLDGFFGRKCRKQARRRTST
jgi:hypothetical protein